MTKLYSKLAMNNLRNNRAILLPYLASGIMTTAFSYLMLFIKNNPGLENMIGGDILRTIMTFGSAVIVIFGYIFLFYTNSFIIKKRKKEIGVYNILGMGKRHIGKILALETLVTAIVAIGGGLLFGILFSKFSMMLLYRILGFKESIVFHVSASGVYWTVFLFGMLYILILIFNLFQIRMANPIDLLKGGNVGEREPKTKLVMAVLGLSFLSIAYYISITTEKPIKVIGLFFIAVLMVIVGTYFLFIAGSIVVLKLLRRNRKYYYHKRHFASVSGMLYRMKQNAAGLASICILSTMVLVMLSTTISMFLGTEETIRNRLPAEFNLAYYLSDEEVAVTEDQKWIEDSIQKAGRTITGQKHYCYLTCPMILKDSEFRDRAPQAGNQWSEGSFVTVMTRRDFLQMEDRWKDTDLPEPEEGQILLFSDVPFPYSKLSILGETFEVISTVSDFKPSRDEVMISTFDGHYHIICSPDTQKKIFQLLRTTAKTDVVQYSAQWYIDIDGNGKEKLDCAKAVREQLQQNKGKRMGFTLQSKQEGKDEFYGLYGGMFFLGIFLGILFLMVTVMIIFYKQISEGYDDRERYRIMKQVGMSEQEVRSSIRSQIRTIFFLPIITASIHLAAAFPMLVRMLQLFAITNTKLIISCMVLTVAVFLVIYYIVFKLTSRVYYRLVNFS